MGSHINYPIVTLVVTMILAPTYTAMAFAATISFNIGDEDRNSFSDRLSYEIEDFNAWIGNLCPSGSCTFELDDAEFRENSASYAWVLEGTLKVSTELPDGGTETYNYDLWGSMDRLRTVETV